MGHTVGDQASRAVKKSEKKQAEAQRTPEERLSAIRSSLAPGCIVSVTRDDQRFLLAQYDSALRAVVDLADRLKGAHVSIMDESENRSTTVKAERLVPGTVCTAAADAGANEIADTGGEA